LRVAVATLFDWHPMEQRDVVYVISKNQVCKRSYEIAMNSIVYTLVICEVNGSRTQNKRSSRHTVWFVQDDGGKLYLVRSANTSRFS
jgi:hypothetical protein